MKLMYFRASIVPVLFTLAACAPEPTLEVPKEFQKGQALFHKTCANCHGADALGKKTKAPKLIDVDFLSEIFSDDDIRETVRNGTDKMPSQKAKVNDFEVTEIIKYLRYSQMAADLTTEEDLENEEDIGENGFEKEV